jgi:hypothetical protein
LNDVKNDNIVDISDNTFRINPTVERLTIPERNRPIVKDHSGKAAINIAFPNPTHLYVSGSFNYETYRMDVELDHIDTYMPG